MEVGATKRRFCLYRINHFNRKLIILGLEVFRNTTGDDEKRGLLHELNALGCFQRELSMQIVC